MRESYPLIFEAQDGCNAYVVNGKTRDEQVRLPQALLRKQAPRLPNISEPGLIRHYIGLSRRNMGVDNLFYPLGSCTMKYNPKINEAVASMEGFTQAHPLRDQADVQGSLMVMYTMQQCLCALTGMDAFTLQPAAGAHGELTGLMLIQAYHKARGERHRDTIIVPDSAHGTNPASASMAGYKVKEIKSRCDGRVDLDALREECDGQIAGLMLTNPSTLGLFETDILEIANIVHQAGGLLYYDGANLNATMGVCRPGDTGFDVVHLNLHKTLSTPHGGGGPGSGAVGVKQSLAGFLPGPNAVRTEDGHYALQTAPQSIGKVRSFCGNFGVYLRALAYMLSLGDTGLTEASQMAVLNANYMMEKLKANYEIPFGEGRCMHEFVVSAADLAEHGIRATDIAKALIDAGYHPPTMYFPLIVKEALMIEPTETESKQTLDDFIAALDEIAARCETAPEGLHAAPLSTPVGRMDEVAAARKPVIRYKEETD